MTIRTEVTARAPARAINKAMAETTADKLGNVLLNVAIALDDPKVPQDTKNKTILDYSSGIQTEMEGMINKDPWRACVFLTFLLGHRFFTDHMVKDFPLDQISKMFQGMINSDPVALPPNLQRFAARRVDLFSVQTILLTKAALGTEAKPVQDRLETILLNTPVLLLKKMLDQVMLTNKLPEVARFINDIYKKSLPCDAQPGGFTNG